MILVVMVFAILLLDGVDVQLLAMVAPVVVKEWAVSKAAFAIPMSAALVGMAAGSSFGGKLGDRFGHRIILVGAALLFGVATISTSLSLDVVQLAILRVIGGLGFGAATPNGVALVSEWLKRGSRHDAVALLSIGPPSGALVGTFGVMALLPLVGWRGCFVVAGIVTLILTGIFWQTSRYADDRKVPETLPILSPEPAPERLLTRSLARTNIGIWLSFFSLSIALFATTIWSPVFLSAAGLPLELALQGIFWFSLMSITTSLFTGRAIIRFGSLSVLLVQLAGATAVSVANALILVSGTAPDAPWLVFLCMAGLGACVGSGMASLYILASASYPARLRGTGVGVAIAASRVGAIFSVLLTGTLLDLRPDGAAMHVMIVLALLTAIAGVLTFDRHLAKGARRPGTP
jgi:AAHS family 4-hydroxybenzoate transporter-like MFS transporter